MSPRRGERAAPPPVEGEYDLRFASSQAADGWEEIGRQVGGNLRRAFDAIPGQSAITIRPGASSPPEGQPGHGGLER
jgi:hypothetical protein